VTYLCQTRQVDQRQAEDMGRVYFEVYGLSVDALVVTCNPGGFILNLPLNLGEVVEPPAGNMKELSPFLLAGC
jgi:hypothetical protein